MPSSALAHRAAPSVTRHLSLFLSLLAFTSFSRCFPLSHLSFYSFICLFLSFYLIFLLLCLPFTFPLSLTLKDFACLSDFHYSSLWLFFFFFQPLSLSLSLSVKPQNQAGSIFEMSLYFFEMTAALHIPSLFFLALAWKKREGGYVNASHPAAFPLIHASAESLHTTQHIVPIGIHRVFMVWSIRKLQLSL